MTRQQLSQAAERHHREMLEKYPPELYKSEIISKDFTLDAITCTKFPMEIAVTENDTVTEILNHQYDEVFNVVAALNFASFTSPGGGFMQGMLAQEEGLCHYSNLYEVLSKQQAYYDYNKKHINSGAYENRAIFSYGIPFEKDGNQGFCDIITCAAPNLYHYEQLASDKKPFDNSAVLKSRIKFILDIAESKCVDTLILGAWGCGAFSQNPVEVAFLFKEQLEESDYLFGKVIFAIPPGENYLAFDAVFNKA